MTFTALRLDAAATSWRDFTQANTPPSAFQRALARFCDRFVSDGTLAQVAFLRRAVQACQAWDGSEAAFRERFVEKTLRERAPAVPQAVLAGIVDRLAPRRTVVDDGALGRILEAVQAAQADWPLPADVEAALVVLKLLKERDTIDSIESGPGGPRGVIDFAGQSLAVDVADQAMKAVREAVRALSPQQQAALTVDSLDALYERALAPLRRTL